MKRVALAALYVGSVVAANWLTQRFGVLPLVGGLSVVAGTWAVGVAILTRNLGQDALGRGVDHQLDGGGLPVVVVAGVAGVVPVPCGVPADSLRGGWSGVG